jgi:hypothetical protein
MDTIQFNGFWDLLLTFARWTFIGFVMLWCAALAVAHIVAVVCIVRDIGKEVVSKTKLTFFS